MRASLPPPILGDLFAESAQHVVPIAAAKGVQCMLDYRGPPIDVAGDAKELRLALHQVFSAAVEVIDRGFVFFTADIDCIGTPQCRLIVEAACTGTPVPDDVITHVLGRLQLHEKPRVEGDASAANSRAATGVCSAVGGELSFVSIPTEGMLFTLTAGMPGAVAHDVPAVDAGGARAWLISEDSITYRSLERRLQALGWSTKIFADVNAAATRLDEQPDEASRPSLVVAYESPNLALSHLRWLWSQLPASTQVVLAAQLGSASLATSEPGVEVRAWPFSPSELVRFTRQLNGEAHPPADDTMPAALTFASRRRALVVDDNLVNQIVATGLLQVLGLEVDIADDGDDAVESCLREPPDFVLMDIHMPRMDGIEATRRLRALQREGTLPRFPIVAATAGTSEAACEDVGMDGFLTKPLSVEKIGRELRRLLPR